MAARKSGGFRAAIASGITLVILAGAVMAIVQNNNIKSVSDLYDYFKGWSDKIWSCGAGDLEWNCDFGGEDNSGDNGTTNPDDPNSTTDPTDPGATVEPTDDPTNVDPANPDTTPQPDEISKLAAQLEALTISERQEVDYVRSDWKHWTGSPCNTREDVLNRQGTDVVNDEECRAVSGTWIDPYSGDTYSNASDLDIDHVIPLGYAASQGGNEWSKEMKEQFANDMSQLLAVDAGENRSKSDRGPSEYMPPNKEFHCEYAEIWISTATTYSLSIEESDKKALSKALSSCEA